MTDETATVCRRRVAEGGRSVRSHICGRKPAGDEEYPELCGLHAAAARRRKTKALDRLELELKRKMQVEKIDARVEHVNKTLGLHAKAETRFTTRGPEAYISHATGEVKVKLEELEELAVRVIKVLDLVPAHVLETLAKLDGTTASSVRLLTGLTPEQLDELGGVDETAEP